MSDPEGTRSSARDRHTAEARRLQARTWVTITVIWIVMLTIVMFDNDAGPWVRVLFVVTGLCQGAAAILWLSGSRRGR